MSANSQEQSRERLPQVSQLVTLAHQYHVELFRSSSGMAFAGVRTGHHDETWPVQSSSFRGWLGGIFADFYESIPSVRAVREAADTLEGEALYRGEVREVFVRFAYHRGAIYLDLADEDRRVIEMTAEDWRVTTTPPVRFRRPKGMFPLPVPERGGSLDELIGLREGLDAPSQILIQAWVLSTLQPNGSLPILILGGEQGSAKSSMTGMLKRVVDPSQAVMRSEPRDVEALMIAANNARVPAFDNLSHIPPWMSDALCRLSSGAGLSKRELYSDSEETILEARRPVVLNGIEDLATRGDLLDRSLLVTLPPVKRRRTEQDVEAAFAEAHPRILGALLDAAVCGLRNLPTTTASTLPRLADFALWVEACAPALGWPRGAFLEMYLGHREDSSSLALEGAPIAGVVLRIIEDGGPFDGTPQELLERLTVNAPLATVKHRTWPASPKALSSTLRRLAPDLRQAGVEVVFGKRTKRGCRVQLGPVHVNGAGGAQ